MSHLQIPTCSGAQPLHSFLKLLPALVLSLVALAACGTAAAPHAGSPTQPASGGMAPTMAKAPTSARAQAAPPSQAAPAADPRGLGDPSAPITIVEYSDYQ